MSDNGKPLHMLPPGKVRAIKRNGDLFQVTRWSSDGFVIRFHVVTPDGNEVEEPLVYWIHTQSTWNWVDKAAATIEIYEDELALKLDTRP